MQYPGLVPGRINNKVGRTEKQRSFPYSNYYKMIPDYVTGARDRVVAVLF